MNDAQLFASLADLDPERGGSVDLTTEDEALLRVLLETAPESSRPDRRRVRQVRLAVLCAAAAVLVSLVVVEADRSGGVGPGVVRVSPAAAAILDRAAAETLAESDPVVRPGQFLRITLVEEHWTCSCEDGERDSDGGPLVKHERWTRDLYVPHDIDAPWTVVSGSELVRNYSSDLPPLPPELAMTTRLQDSWANPSGDRYIASYDPRWYDDLPRDPARLLRRLTPARQDGEPGDFAWAIREVYSEYLRSGLAPADVRAALFRALADQPGIDVVDGVVDQAGRAGIALRHVDSDWQMVFDRNTGQYIGERQESHLPDFPELDGVDTAFTATVTTTVVDSVPTVR